MTSAISGAFLDAARPAPMPLDLPEPVRAAKGMRCSLLGWGPCETGGMCVACHYRGDNQLVSVEVRREAHVDGGFRCVRPVVSPDVRSGPRWWCIDCGVTLPVPINHLCERIAKIQVEGPTMTGRAVTKARRGAAA
jgi:hypothetical protein